MNKNSLPTCSVGPHIVSYITKLIASGHVCGVGIELFARRDIVEKYLAYRSPGGCSLSQSIRNRNMRIAAQAEFDYLNTPTNLPDDDSKIVEARATNIARFNPEKSISAIDEYLQYLVGIRMVNHEIHVSVAEDPSRVDALLLLRLHIETGDTYEKLERNKKAAQREYLAWIHRTGR